MVEDAGAEEIQEASNSAKEILNPVQQQLPSEEHPKVVNNNLANIYIDELGNIFAALTNVDIKPMKNHIFLKKSS